MFKRIGIIILIGFVALASQSCDKSDGAASTEEQKTLIDFAASSHEAATKGSPLSEHHPDFGVWGYARRDGQTDYVLWENSAMTKAARKGTSNVYIPVEDAFWLSGYTYDFLAVAPWESAEGITSIDAGTTSGAETLSFSCDMSDKYRNGVYDFDLMAAAAQTTVDAAATHPSSQDLSFRHLFAKINIRVRFVDGNGNTADGSVSQMRLHNIDCDATYTISADEDGSVKVLPSPGARTHNEDPLLFNDSNYDTTISGWTLNIISQDISSLKLFMDFSINGASYGDFEINLNPGGSAPTEYAANGQYNWNITIGPKAQIGFRVEVAEWEEETVPDGEDDDNDDVEII